MSNTTATQAPAGPKLDSIREFAVALNISVSGAWRILRTDPDAPRPLKVGARIRLRRVDVERYIDVLVLRAQHGQHGESAGVRLSAHRWRPKEG